MRKVLITAVLGLLLPLPAMAQEYPKAELFGGYSYFRANPEGFNLNGWNGSVAGNVTPWFGLVADFSGQYGHPSDYYVTYRDVNISNHTFMGGPKLSLRDRNFVAFAHFLIGAARASTAQGGISVADTALAAAIGAGLDFRLSRSVSVRAIQADYLMTRFRTTDYPYDERQNNVRLSFGLVLKFR